uniref:Uncharacterized protein n=1 Tax=Kalanchoe fedtschenkoi TaxID=63787 RepID=A0A7N0UP59_KALFE
MGFTAGGLGRVNHGTLFLVICGVLLLCVHKVASSSRLMADKVESDVELKTTTVEMDERAKAVLAARAVAVDGNNNTKKDDGHTAGDIYIPAPAWGIDSGLGSSSQGGDEDEHHGVDDGAGGLFKHAHDHLHKLGILAHKAHHEYHFHDRHDDQLPDSPAAAGHAGGPKAG